ncbi:MAG: tail fiber domain-containing protein [Bacteroidota bacterium]|nr:tail fiber domain-containing protein [Bacteroidota bacterium]
MKKLVLIFVLGFIALSFGAFAQIKVASNGYVGIITTNPVYKLDINSGESRSWYSTAYPLGINHWGSDPRLTSASKIVFYKTDATGFIDIECRSLFTNSDMNLKENISPLETSGAPLSDTNVAKISRLKGVNYTWKNDKDKKVQVGFLAQEVETVIPEAVITNDSTKIKSMSYDAIIPYLVEAIKEQQSQIETLKKLVNK